MTTSTWHVLLWVVDDGEDRWETQADGDCEFDIESVMTYTRMGIEVVIESVMAYTWMGIVRLQ
jgi:hypothetical protein